MAPIFHSEQETLSVRAPSYAVIMENRALSVAQKRNYAVDSTKAALAIAGQHLRGVQPGLTFDFGLPEVDDRYHLWRIPVVSRDGARIGEVCIDARTGVIDHIKSSALAKSSKAPSKTLCSDLQPLIPLRPVSNVVVQGDARTALTALANESVDLVFTSPPYFNARPDYAEYGDYETYLDDIRSVIRQSHRLLAEGRFIVINISPVLIRRKNRNESSQRIAVPFDFHRLLIEEGFDFIDDIIWVKPTGAGWATGRGRRFAADRNPLQYKAVPVTEYVLVYRKRTKRLIDWNIRSHHDQGAVKASKIVGSYEATNIWRISPASSRKHPAIFPRELADRVLKYYSFEGDLVLDPFAGIGTVAAAAIATNRRFALCEIDPGYIETIKDSIVGWLGSSAEQTVEFLGTEPPDYSILLA